MVLKSPVRERAEENFEKIGNLLDETRQTIEALKADWVRMQKFENTAYLRDVEKLLEKTQAQFEELRKSQ